MTAYFVTATGTDIGKTFVTAGLVRMLRKRGEPVDALKPIASGFDIATAAISDPGQLLGAMEEPITEEALNRICPWRFAAPLSPDMAAAREGKCLDYDAILQFCRDAIAQTVGTLLIEGVGGVMVPLDETRTVLDWMAALNLPVLLVAGTYLGTISHTLTALDVLARRKLSVKCLALNDSGDGAVPVDDTVAAIQRFVPSLPIVAIPRVGHHIDAQKNLEALWRAMA